MKTGSPLQWVRVAVLAAVVVAAILMVFRYRYVTLNNQVYRIDALTGYSCEYPCTDPGPQPAVSLVPTPSPTPFNADAQMATQPIRDQVQYAQGQRWEALQASAPFDFANFGQTMETRSLRLNMVIKEVFESTDGSVYVVYSECATEGAGCERFHLGMLSGEKVVEIWLPHRGPDWSFLQLLASTGGDSVYVAGSGAQYRVNAREIVRTRVADKLYAQPTPPATLTDGERCSLETTPRSAVLVWGVRPDGKRRPLISRESFLEAAHNAVHIGDVTAVRCSHFHDVNLLFVGNAYAAATFVVRPDKVYLAAGSAPWITTPNHLLFMSTEVDASGGVRGVWDYLIVTPKPSSTGMPPG